MSERSRVALVPARGGSKRIPRKNVRDFRGAPLLARTLAMLWGSQLFDRVVVSTDDDEVADVARAAGAEVPFLRPAALADDHTPTRPVVVHALDALRGNGDHDEMDSLCVAYPAAVFVEGSDLQAALAQLVTPIEFVFSASTFTAPVQRALRLDVDGRPTLLAPEHAMTRSQDLEETYHDAGQFYWGRPAAWRSGRSVLEANSRLHVLPPWRVQDIDTPDDWTRAELLHELLARR